MSVSFLEVDESYPDEICGICWDPLAEDVWAHEIHRFHGRCISDWVAIQPTCPSCRETVDTTSLLGKDILQDQLDRRYEENEARKLRWKLKAVEIICEVGVFGCLVAPYISERHSQNSEVLRIASCYLVGVVILIQCYFYVFDREAQ